MGIPWRDAYRLIPNLTEILRAQDGAVPATHKPACPPVAVPTCTRLEVSPGRWRVTIAEWCPASDNVRAKGLKKWMRAKAADREVIRTWLVDYARVPRATGRRRLSAWVTKKGPRPDATNLWKSLADACVQCGLLVDDGPDWFDAGPIAVAKGDVTSTTVLVEDIA